MKKIGLLVICLMSLQTFYAQDFFSDADKFFKKYTSNGSVDYQAIQNQAEDLERLVQKIATFKPTEENEKAFLLNAYNILIIEGVLNHAPISSVMDANQFFDEKVYNVAGKKVSLNSLEKGWLYKKYPDPRLHFALICGAKGCPPIASEAYYPNTLSKQLDTQTERSLNNSTFIQLKELDRKVMVSKIFDWYSSDFGGSDNILQYINKYRTKSININYDLSYYEYDWSLNGPTVKKK